MLTKMNEDNERDAANHPVEIIFTVLGGILISFAALGIIISIASIVSRRLKNNDNRRNTRM